MIQNVITYLNVGISNLNIFGQVSGLSEFITEDDKKFPAVYSGRDNLRFVTSYDFRNGLAFHVKNGEARQTELERIISSSAYIELIQPMRMVVIAKRGVTGEDSGYSDEQLVANVKNVLNNRNINQLRSILKLNRISTTVTGYDTNKEILDDIFQNVDINFRHDLSFAVIDYDIRLEGNQVCFDGYTCSDIDFTNAICPFEFQYDLYINGEYYERITININEDINITT